MGPQLGRALEQPRGMGASVGDWSKWRDRQDSQKLPAGLTPVAESSPPPH